VGGARELRLVVTASDYDEALHFYRDVLELAERATFTSNGGRVTILEAGRATLELADRRTPSTSTASRWATVLRVTSAGASRSKTP
jgi:predicted enzyme related to lactoylglutathione lyase